MVLEGEPAGATTIQGRSGIRSPHASTRWVTRRKLLRWHRSQHSVESSDLNYSRP